MTKHKMMDPLNLIEIFYIIFTLILLYYLLNYNRVYNKINIKLILSEFNSLKLVNNKSYKESH